VVAEAGRRRGVVAVVCDVWWRFGAVWETRSLGWLGDGDLQPDCGVGPGLGPQGAVETGLSSRGCGVGPGLGPQGAVETGLPWARGAVGWWHAAGCGWRWWSCCEAVTVDVGVGGAVMRRWWRGASAGRVGEPGGGAGREV